MDVLNLVTSTDSTCFGVQVRMLERMGVGCTNLSVEAVAKNRDGGDRSPAAYLRFYPRVLAHSFGSYDLVHANYGLTAPAAIAQPNLPIVLSLWGSDLMGKYGRVSRWCAEFADAVIVMSEQMAGELDVDCYVIPHGIDFDSFQPMPQGAAREAVGWDPETKYVLFPYSPSRRVKNYPRAERIVESVREKMDDSVRLEVLSGVDHDRVSVYMNAADALLLTSRHEGSPNTVKEAMACNLPVVTADVGDVSERLRGVSPSAVCETDEQLVDSLVSVLSESARSDGRRKVKKGLSQERMGERILDVYRNVLSA